MARQQLNVPMTPELIARLNKAIGAVAAKTGELPSKAALVREMIENGLDELEKLLADDGATSPE